MTRRAKKGLPPAAPSHGVVDLSPESRLEMQREIRENRKLAKAQRREAYESEMAEHLAAVSYLQRMCIDVANDPDVILSPAQMQKMQLGLKAAGMVLDRVLGKAVTLIEGELTVNVIQEMAEADAAWVIEDAQVVDDE